METFPYQTGAYIDLKTVDFFFEDGYSAAGAVNNASGYPIGTTVLVVDGFTVAPSTETVVTFGTNDTKYRLVSSTTTSITITPGLAAAVVDNAVVNVGPHRANIKIGQGNLTYDENVAREYILNRGLIDQVRDGDQVPMDVNFGFAWLYVVSETGAIRPSPYEFLNKEGPAAAYVSTGGDCEPFAINIVMVNNSNSTTCANLIQPREKVVLPAFRFEKLAHDAKAGQINCTGKCNARKAIKTRLDA